MKYPCSIALFILVGLVICVSPALCATKYVGASPAITAYIGGTNEYSPGEDATITVVLQNGGTNWLELTHRGTIASEDIGTTAKLVKVGLAVGTAPIVIKTDPQQIGDLASPGKTTVKFTTKITQDATLGEYQLPLTVTY
ncbi:MAG: S-layer protein, partial [Methanoregula sp.]